MEDENIITVTVIDREKQEHSLEAPTDMGMNMMEVLKSYELPVEGICGGMAMCASCQCYVHTEQHLGKRNDDEQAMLDDADNVKDNSRLACQMKVTDKLNGMIIELAPEMVPDDDDDW